MNNLRKAIIMLLILMLLIITIIIIAISSINKNKEGSDYNDTEFEKDISHEEIKNTISEVTNRNEYYAVKNIIGKYAYAISDGGSQSLCYMLNKEYLDDNKIDEKNVYQVVERLKNENLTEYELNNFKLTINVEKMFYVQSNINIKSFFAYGNFSNNVNSEKIDFKIIVQTDTKNNTFYIYPTSFVEENYSNENDINNYSTNIEQIDRNDYNTFSFVNISDTTIINDYMAKFKNSLVDINEDSYNLLDDEYRKKKFDNCDEYKNYVSKHLNELLSINITKYKKEEKDKETRYICLDANGNYYILNETAIMQFSIMLDTYTVVLPEFADKYDGVNNTRKVGMNVDKVVQALNMKDVKYIYDNLDETFKENNFSTLADLERYINAQYPSTYDLQYSDYSEENGTYIQNIILIDRKTNEQKEVSIIMQLKDNYEFVMSFTVG